MGTTLRQQLSALLKRNLLLKKRNKKGTVQEFLMPVYFVLLLALIKFLTQPDTSPPIQSFPVHDLNQSIFKPDAEMGPVILVYPNTSQVKQVMDAVLKQLSAMPGKKAYSYMMYATAEEAEEVFTYNRSMVAGGVEFSDGTLTNMDYAIRMENNKLASTDNLWTSPGQCRINTSVIAVNCEANSYLLTGFTVLQSAIDTVLLKMASGAADLPSQKFSVQQVPKFEWTPSITTIQTLSAIYYVLAYAPFVNFLTLALVREKEKKIKEAMRMMGMKDAAFWLSWSIIYLVMIMIVTGLVTLLAFVASFVPNSNMFIFYLILLLYGLSIINMAFMMSTFFSKSQIAGDLAGFITMLFSLLYLAVSLTRDSAFGPDGPVSSIPVWAQYLMALISPVALALAMDQTIFLDISKGGMNFSTLGVGQFPLSASLIMLAVDVVLYGLLAFYLDNVVPNEHGMRRPPWYICMPSFWFPRKRQPEETFLMSIDQQNGMDGLAANIEPVPQALRGKDALRISNIHKRFKTRGEEVKAVNGISLSMYEGQITALLGHNGAGKTTLINMLTGMSAPTSGTAYIYGLDVSDTNDMTEIRSMTGVCPQHNILFDDLTCAEHLQFYGTIKGLVSDKLDSEIAKVLKELNMDEQKDTFGKQLSGGQKRKLCVAIALIGDPKVIFLDEPSAGMDPASRRHLWALLKEKQEGRVVLLTTHFMDEADILADRKAIVSKGKLRCCGSSLFLKNKFGIGYHLSFVVDDSADKEVVTDVVHTHIPEAQFQRRHGNELAYTLPLSAVDTFSALFGYLEDESSSDGNRATKLGITSYGVSMTTLEEVFLKLGAEAEMEDEEEEPEVDLNDGSTQHLVTTNKQHAPSMAQNTTINNGSPNSTDHQLESQLEQAAKTMTKAQLRRQRFWALVKMRTKLIYRIKAKFFFQIIFPMIFLISGAAVNSTSGDSTPTVNAAPLTFLPSMYFTLGGTTDKSVTPLAYKISASDDNSSDFVNELASAGLKMDLVNNTDQALYDKPPHNGALNLFGVSVLAQEVDTNVMLVYNSTAKHSIPVLLNLFTNTLLRLLMPSSGINITTTSKPWPGQTPGVYFNGAVFGSTILLGMAVAFVPGGFAIGAVYDRVVVKGKSQLRISGVTMDMYWICSFFVDYFQYLFMAVISIIVLLAFQVPSVTQTGGLISIILVYLFYLPVNILFAYNISFLFNNYEFASGLISQVWIYMAFLPYIVVGTVDMTGNVDVGTALHYTFCVINPAYAVFGGLYYIDRLYLIGQLTQATLTPDIPTSEYFKWSSHIPITYVMPFLHAVGLYILLRYVEVRKTGGDTRDVLCAKSKGSVRDEGMITNPDVAEDEDSDVKAEREKIANWQPGAQDREPVVLVQNLRKKFILGEQKCCQKNESKTKVAVRNNSFTVMPGEVFGLLGPNGAGKTTTLNMIIAEESPDIGKVVVAGHNIRSSLSEAFQVMGYCPQHDPLYDYLTLREHLQLYAGVQGVHPDQIPTVIQFYLDSLNIGEHAEKIAKTLSGGTKRKLSYAISMLSFPELLLLDEPSTGMDPKSKRFLWDAISGSFAGSDRGAILTTHYMEEADALCSRLAIMVNGQMECLGSTQHLKNKYGNGYMLEVKLKVAAEGLQKEKMDIFHEYITSSLPNCSQTECFGERAMYKVPQTSVTSLAKIFTVLEAGKEKFDVEEYSFSQATLEQVFLELARHQLEEGEEEDALVTAPDARNESTSAHTSPTHQARSMMRLHSQPSVDDGGAQVAHL